MTAKKELLLLYIFSFVITWICFVFWVNKDDFDIEYREKAIAVATIISLNGTEVEEEKYGGREIEIHDVEYVEYSYSVDGKLLKSSSLTYGEDYSIADNIQIEYVKSNPLNTRISDSPKYGFNYFIRNLIPVSIFSGLLMIFISKILELTLKNKQRYSNND